MKSITVELVPLKALPFISKFVKKFNLTFYNLDLYLISI